MRWLVLVFFVSTLLSQVTLSEEEAKNIAINIQELEIKSDSLNKIVILQNELILTYKENIAQDSVTISEQDNKIKILEEETKLLTKKAKLVKPSWYENKWLYFGYGATLSYAVIAVVNKVGSISDLFK